MADIDEKKTAGDFILYEQPDYSISSGIIGAGADLDPGTVLGKVTATGKFIRSVRTAADGSETPVAVLRVSAAAAAADVPGVAMNKRHTRMLRTGLIFDASYGTEAERNAACDALEAVGIIAE